MKLSQGEFYTNPGYFDLVSESGAQLVEYQGEAPTAGATPSMLQSIVDFGKALIPAVLSYEQQKDLNEINIERARKGLSPIDAQKYMAQAAPQVRVGMTSDTQNMLLYGVMIAAAAGVVMMLARGRR